MFAKMGPPHEAEDPLSRDLVLLDHLGARDVGGHEVGGELDAVEPEVQRVGQRRDDEGLGQPRNAHQEDVTVRHHRGHDSVDDVLLADDAALHLSAQIVGDLAGAAQQPDVAVRGHVGWGGEGG